MLCLRCGFSFEVQSSSLTQANRRFLCCCTSSWIGWLVSPSLNSLRDMGFYFTFSMTGSIKWCNFLQDFCQWHLTACWEGVNFGQVIFNSFEHYSLRIVLHLRRQIIQIVKNVYILLTFLGVSKQFLANCILQILLCLLRLLLSWDFLSSLTSEAAEYTPLRVFLEFLSKRCKMGTL